MKKFLLLLILFILSPLFYHQLTVKAHEVGETWIYINNTKLQDNQIPNPSSLHWASHITTKSFEVGEVIQLKLIEDIIKEKFEVENFEAECIIKNKREFSIKQNSSNLSAKKIGDEFFAVQMKGLENDFTFANSGSYFIEIHLSALDEIFESEEFMVIAGSAPEMADFKVNGDSYKNRDLLKIERSTPLLFEIENPDFENFNYFLDLGEGDEFLLNEVEGNSIKKGFLSSKLPLYIVLRKEDKSSGLFQDSYIRIDSEEESNYKIVTPSNPISSFNSDEPLKLLLKASSLCILMWAIIPLIFIFILLKKPHKQKNNSHVV